MIWKMTSLPFEEKRNLDKSSLIHEPFFSSTLGISRNTECHLERKKGSDRFHLLANSSRRFHRVCREDTSLFLSFFLCLSISLSLSLPRRHRLDQDVTYRRILFSVDASWKRFAACHFVGLTSFRSSSFPPFRPNTSSPTRNICNTITRFTVKSKYSNAYVFGERNVYTLKRVVWDNEGYSRRETSQDYVNLKMIHLFMR